MAHELWPPNGNLSQYILDQFPPNYQGWGIDVGASDGISINSTYHLENAHRWTILSVEANPEFSAMLKKYRAFVEMCACSDHTGEEDFHVNITDPEAFSALRLADRKHMDEHQLANKRDPVQFKKVKVRVDTVDALMQKWQFPQLDLLCVDTEGTELDVLRGCDIAHWKPKVIVTECWHKVSPIDVYLGDLGYKKIARNVHNDIFIRND